jgi:hypothetical protein
VYTEAVRAGAVAAGSSTVPEVAIHSVKTATLVSRRRLLSSTGVAVDTEVSFKQGGAAAAAVFAAALRSSPQSVLPTQYFGAVTVPKVVVRKGVTPGGWVGIGVAVAAGVAGEEGCAPICTCVLASGEGKD